MALCKFTDSAKIDLEDIAEYTLKLWGKMQSIKYLDEIESKIIALSHNPNIGTQRNDLYSTLLSFPIRRHVIYYLKQEGTIFIVRILHAQMCHRLHHFPIIESKLN